MKKWITIAVLLLLSLPVAAPADDFTYTTNNGKITITGYTGFDSDVTIPGTMNGLPVTIIGTNAFDGCGNLTSVVISSNITSISDWAFAGCVSMTNIAIPNSVTNLADYAFFGCYSLIDVTIPDRVTRIGNQAFSYCQSLTSITIPGSVTSLGFSVFFDCLNLTAITVDAFNPILSSSDDGVLFNKGKTSLIAYPPGKIERNFTITKSVTNIEDGTFFNCTNLTEITVDAPNPTYSSVNGILFNKNQDKLLVYPAGRSGISYTIPDSVIRVEVFAFFCCGLSDIEIGRHVTDIGAGAFEACGNLSTVTIPDRVANIGVGAFHLCDNLSTVTLGKGVTNVGNYAFADCPGLQNVYFLGDAPSIGPDLFFNPFDPVNATVYYLPGTKNWNATFADRPTVLWNPKIQTGDTDFGVRSNRFGFKISGTNDFTVVVEACTNLASGIWVPVATNTLTGGSVQFSDPASTNYPKRYYRVSMPQ